MPSDLGRDFYHGSIFKQLPQVSRAVYLSEAPSGARLFEIETQEGIRRLHLLEIIQSDEKEIWESVKDVIGFALKEAETRLFGTFSLELITVGERVKFRNLDPRAFAELLINHGRIMNPGEEKIFSYSSLWLRFQKRVPGDWGKIRFQHGICIYSGERAKLDLILKKQIQEASGNVSPTWILIRDFSGDPVFRFGEEPQTERISKMLTKHKEVFQKNILGLLIVEESRAIDLIQQFGVLENQA